MGSFVCIYAQISRSIFLDPYNGHKRTKGDPSTGTTASFTMPIYLSMSMSIFRTSDSHIILKSQDAYS